MMEAAQVWRELEGQTHAEKVDRQEDAPHTHTHTHTASGLL